MGTGFRVVRNARKHMRFLGNGCYSAVFALNDERVVKIGTNVEDPWLDYIKGLDDNPHFPWVYRLRVFSGYYVAEIERLEPVPLPLHGITHALSDWIRFDKPLDFKPSNELELAKRYICSFSNKHMIDTHIGNFMYRPSTLTQTDVNRIVIIDPLADETISDDRDLSYWYDTITLREMCL